MQHKLRSKTQIIYQRMLNITKHGNRLNWNQRHRRPSHAHQLLCIEKEWRPPVSKFLNIIKYISLTIQQWKTVHKWLDPQEVTTDITQANTKVLIACYNFPKVSRNSILVYIYVYVRGLATLLDAGKLLAYVRMVSLHLGKHVLVFRIELYAAQWHGQRDATQPLGTVL